MASTSRVLLYPKDLLLELEYWARNGDYTLDELEEVINLIFKYPQPPPLPAYGSIKLFFQKR
jgi:hypothetical protein